MAPFISAREEMVGGSGDTDASSPSSPSTTTILIVVAAVSGASILAFCIFLLVDRKQSRQYQEACKKDPYLSRKEFARRRKMSSLERLEEEELQRSIMIRKSLAVRSSRTNSQASDIFNIPAMREVSHSRNFSQESVASGRGRDRSNSVPSITSSQPDWRDRELPPPPPRSRTVSPSRSPLLKPRASSPLPSLPTFEHGNDDWPEVLLPRSADVPPAHLH